jgi:hypothetical protein
MLEKFRKFTTLYLAFSAALMGMKPWTVGAKRNIEENIQNYSKPTWKTTNKDLEQKFIKNITEAKYDFIVETSRKRYQNFDNAMEQMLKSIDYSETEARNIIQHAKAKTHNEVNVSHFSLVNDFLHKAHHILNPKKINRYNVTWGDTLDKYDDQTIKNVWNTLKEDAKQFENHFKKRVMNRQAIGRKYLTPKLNYNFQTKHSSLNQRKLKENITYKDEILRLRALLLKPKKTSKEFSVEI